MYDFSQEEAEALVGSTFVRRAGDALWQGKVIGVTEARTGVYLLLACIDALCDPVHITKIEYEQILEDQEKG